MIRDSRPTTELAPIADHHAAGDTGEGRKKTISPKNHAVANLNQVIDLGIFTNDGVAMSAAIDARIGSDCDSILNDDAPQLGYVDHPARPSRGAEPGLADNRAGMNANPITDQREADDGVCAHIAVSAYGHSGPND